MAGTMKNIGNHGFTLVEMAITLAVFGILVAIGSSRFGHQQTVNSINEDMHAVKAFIHTQKMLAFTRKEVIQLDVGANQITTTIDPTGAATPGRTLTLKNSIRSKGAPFTITSRGNISTGNISITVTNTGAQYSCVQLDNIRIRLGVWNGTTCTPI